MSSAEQDITPPTKPAATTLVAPRRSRRSVGEDLSSMASPSVAVARTKLEELLARDCKYGHAYYNGSPSSTWNLDWQYQMFTIQELYDVVDEEEVDEIQHQMSFEALSDKELEDKDREEDKEVATTDKLSPTVVSGSTSALMEPLSLSNLDKRWPIESGNRD